MSIIDKVLEANRNYAQNYNPTLGKRPAPKIAVVTCMDPRLSDLPGILGLPQADIDVINLAETSWHGLGTHPQKN
jgi:carbonic anhydrase